MDFNETEIEYLNHTSCRSFYTQQPDRFEVLSDRCAEMGLNSILAAEHAGRGCFKWFDSFLDAKIYQSYYQQTQGNDSVLLWDLADDYGHCLWIDEEGFFFVSGSHKRKQE